MPVTIAPSTRAKLLRITARDLHPPLRDPFKPLTEMLAAAAVLRPPSRRFWDTDSDSECEDLGDAEVLRSAVSSSPEPLQRPPTGAASSDSGLPSARRSATPPRRSPATPPRRAKPLEIFVEGPFATRKAILAGDSRRIPAAGVRSEDGRSRGESRSAFHAGSIGKQI
jgi:hypothetical protein